MLFNCLYLLLLQVHIHMAAMELMLLVINVLFVSPIQGECTNIQTSVFSTFIYLNALVDPVLILWGKGITLT